MDDTLRKSIFKIISQKLLSTDWKNLGRTLGLEEEDLNAIFADSRHKCEPIRDTYLAMLYEWYRANPSLATVDYIISALQAVKRRDIAQLVKKAANQYEIEQQNSQENNHIATTIPNDVYRRAPTSVPSAPVGPPPKSNVNDRETRLGDHTGVSPQVPIQNNRDRVDSVHQLQRRWSLRLLLRNCFPQSLTRRNISAAGLILGLVFLGFGQEGVTSLLTGLMNHFRSIDLERIGFFLGKLFF